MASITKRNGKWQVRVAWRDTQGNWKSRNKGGFPTKTAARKWGIEQEQLLASGQINTSNPEWPAYFLEWFNTFKKDKISKSTKRQNEFLTTGATLKLARLTADNTKTL